MPLHAQIERRWIPGSDHELRNPDFSIKREKVNDTFPPFEPLFHLYKREGKGRERDTEGKGTFDAVPGERIYVKSDSTEIPDGKS